MKSCASWPSANVVLQVMQPESAKIPIDAAWQQVASMAMSSGNTENLMAITLLSALRDVDIVAPLGISFDRG